MMVQCFPIPEREFISMVNNQKIFVEYKVMGSEVVSAED